MQQQKQRHQNNSISINNNNQDIAGHRRLLKMEIITLCNQRQTKRLFLSKSKPSIVSIGSDSVMYQSLVCAIRKWKIIVARLSLDQPFKTEMLYRGAGFCTVAPAAFYTSFFLGHLVYNTKWYKLQVVKLWQSLNWMFGTKFAFESFSIFSDRDVDVCAIDGRLMNGEHLRRPFDKFGRNFLILTMTTQ